MSETKHTPLPWFWLDRDLVHRDSDETHHVVLDDGSAAGEYVPTIDPTGPDAQLIVTSVNARPKVEELVGAVNKLKGHLEETGEYRICRADKEQMGLPDQMTIGQVLCDIEDKAREVEAALKGEA